VGQHGGQPKTQGGGGGQVFHLSENRELWGSIGPRGIREPGGDPGGEERPCVHGSKGGRNCLGSFESISDIQRPPKRGGGAGREPLANWFGWDGEVTLRLERPVHGIESADQKSSIRVRLVRHRLVRFRRLGTMNR